MRDITAQELGERMQRIRLQVKETAQRVRCDPTSISNFTAGRRRMTDRLKREVVEAVVSEELDLLAHLSRLHPEAAAQLARAA